MCSSRSLISLVCKYKFSLIQHPKTTSQHTRRDGPPCSIILSVVCTTSSRETRVSFTTAYRLVNFTTSAHEALRFIRVSRRLCERMSLRVGGLDLWDGVASSESDACPVGDGGCEGELGGRKYKSPVGARETRSVLEGRTVG